jgi:hypothetical protein
MRFAASVDCFQIIFLMIRLIFVFVLANRLQATWTRTQFSNAARRSRGAVLHQVDMLFSIWFLLLTNYHRSFHLSGLYFSYVLPDLVEILPKVFHLGNFKHDFTPF